MRRCDTAPARRTQVIVDSTLNAPLATAHVGNVLDDVGHPLLRLELVGRARKDLQEGVEAPRRRRVPEDGVAEAVGEDALAQARVLGEFRLGDGQLMFVDRCVVCGFRSLIFFAGGVGDMEDLFFRRPPWAHIHNIHTKAKRYKAHRSIHCPLTSINRISWPGSGDASAWCSSCVVGRRTALAGLLASPGRNSPCRFLSSPPEAAPLPPSFITVVPRARLPPAGCRCRCRCRKGVGSQGDWKAPPCPRRRPVGLGGAKALPVPKPPLPPLLRLPRLRAVAAAAARSRPSSRRRARGDEAPPPAPAPAGLLGRAICAACWLLLP